MKKTIKLDAVEVRKAKNGKEYKRYNTNMGWVSAFDEGVIKKLDQYMGQEVEVDIFETGDYTNIKAFYRPLVETEKVEDKPKKLGSKLNMNERCFEQSFKVFDTLLGYQLAKDKDVEVDKIMELACSLVDISRLHYEAND